MIKRTPSVAALAVTIGLITACGGSSGDSADTDTTTVAEVVATTVSDTTPATEPPTTEPPATAPPATDPPDSGLPEWASGALVTVESDTGPLELPVELAAFCEASRSFFVAAGGLSYLSADQSRSAQQLFAALVALAPVTIDAAPSEEFAAQPTAARDILNGVVPALQTIDFDRTRIAELPDSQKVRNALLELGDIRDDLQSFLIEACGADELVLVDQAQGAADAAAAAAGETPAPPEPDTPVEAVDGTGISNDDETITLAVPVDWTEVEESIDNGRDLLTAAPDIDAFNELAGSGVLVLRGEGGFRDGGFVGRVLDYQFKFEQIGCVLLDERDYDDGVYNGQERIFDCGNPALDVRILGGTEADEALYAMVVLVQPAGELGIRQLIVDTFQVA